MIEMDPDGTLRRGPTHSFHVKPFEGGRLDPAALSITGIDPHHPLRPALPEKDALQRIFREIRHAVRDYNCRRAILVGHNAAFDLGFLNAAVTRADVKRNPFHPFSSFDTATLAGAALGQTVLARGSDGCGAHLGFEQRALRLLRRGADSGPVLHHFKPPARHASAKRRNVRARWVGSRLQPMWSPGKCSWKPRRRRRHYRRSPSRLAAAVRTHVPVHTRRRPRGSQNRRDRRIARADANQAAAVAPTSPNSFFNSPLRYISSAMSHPPISSPFT